MADLASLRTALEQLGSAVLGYSGGIDSSLLAVLGTQALGPDRFLAVMGLSPSYPAVQRSGARVLARRFAIPLLEVETGELDDPRYAANPANRCYFCKADLWNRLGAIARERRLAAVIDGTNADDLGEHRPGALAGAEQSVRSPLAELGWRKADVRQAAQALGLPNWDAPAAPCLASRIQYGLPVTVPRLEQVEAAEGYLRGLGVVGDLRVRHLGSGARVEVGPGDLPLIEARWDEIRSELGALGFQSAERAGYRRGALLELYPDA